MPGGTAVPGTRLPAGQTSVLPHRTGGRAQIRARVPPRRWSRPFIHKHPRCPHFPGTPLAPPTGRSGRLPRRQPLVILRARDPLEPKPMPAYAVAGDSSSRAASSASGGRPERPLLVTRDEALLDEVVRLAAIAGTEIEVVPDPAGARPLWTIAPLVIVGGDLATACARAGLPRRRDLALVASVAGREFVAAEGIWQLATEIGADQVVALPEAESWLLRRLAESLTTPATGRVVAVAPGSGGAGGSGTACDGRTAPRPAAR